MGESIGPDRPEARRQLEEIGKNGAILLEMVDNVLECARIQAGSETLNLELVDLNDLVGMVESAMAPVAAKKGVAFTTRVDFDVPLIMGDWEEAAPGARKSYEQCREVHRRRRRGGCARLLRGERGWCSQRGDAA